jgi:zinc transporter
MDRRGGAEPLSWEQVTRWTPGDGLLWVHLDTTVPAARDWLLGAESGLPPLMAEALTQAETRPRSAVTPEGLLVVLRGVNLNPGADPDDMVSIRMWLTDARVVSTRRRRLLSVDDLREGMARGRAPTSTADFLVAMADRLIDRATVVVQDLDDAVDRLEEEVVTSESHRLRAQLADVRREAIGLRRYLAPQRDVMARLQMESSPLLGEVDRLRLRELADRVTRQVEDLDAARERAAVTSEELASRLAEQMNQRMYVLAIVAAVFLPLGLLTGLLGINVGGMPGAEDPSAFWFVTALLVAAGGAIMAVFKWRKWF